MTITEGFSPVYFGFLPVMQSHFISVSDSNSNLVMCFTINVPPPRGEGEMFYIHTLVPYLVGTKYSYTMLPYMIYVISL